MKGGAKAVKSYRRVSKQHKRERRNQYKQTAESLHKRLEGKRSK